MKKIFFLPLSMAEMPFAPKRVLFTDMVFSLLYKNKQNSCTFTNFYTFVHKKYKRC
jgi:hypothetical protein